MKYDSLTYAEIVEHELKALDLTSATLCKESNIPTHVFKLDQDDGILKAVCGEKIGTFIN